MQEIPQKERYGMVACNGVLFNHESPRLVPRPRHELCPCRRVLQPEKVIGPPHELQPGAFRFLCLT